MLIDWGNEMIGNTDPDYSEHLITDPDSDQYKHLPFRSRPRSRCSSTAASSPDSARVGTART